MHRRAMNPSEIPGKFCTVFLLPLMLMLPKKIHVYLITLNKGLKDMETI